MDATEQLPIPSGFTCNRCGGTGIAPGTAEPIESLPDFHPKTLPCPDCARRAAGIEPYSIWYMKR